MFAMNFRTPLGKQKQKKNLDIIGHFRLAPSLGYEAKLNTKPLILK